MSTPPHRDSAAGAEPPGEPDEGPAGLLAWLAVAPGHAELEEQDAAIVEWPTWRRDTKSWIEPATPGSRQTLDPPGSEQLETLRGSVAVAVLGVSLDSVDDLRCLHETLLVPLLRAGIPVLVECAQSSQQLDVESFVEDGFEHPATLERMRWLCARAERGDVALAAASDAQREASRLDPSQRAAVHAAGGVVQVIAPAGSGKTTVLVDRVAELLARGADPERILCLTFNDAAAAELRSRLAGAGVSRVAARTFESAIDLLALVATHSGIRAGPAAAPVRPAAAERTRRSRRPRRRVLTNKADAGSSCTRRPYAVSVTAKGV